MTDRTITLVVSLDRAYRIDDIDSIIEAIMMIKHVSKVKKNIYSGADQLNVSAGISNYKMNLVKKLIDTIEEN